MASRNSIFFAGWPDEAIDCCAYHRAYFGRIKQAPKYHLSIYRQVLSLAEKSIAPKKKNEAVVLDFGCGFGLLGITAALEGWGHVSFLDMGKHEIENAKLLSKNAGISNTSFYHGDENLFSQLDPVPDVLIGLDVIEHVYNLKDFLHQAKAKLPGTTLLFTTGVVDDNFLKAPAIRKIQQADELQFTGERDALDGKSFKAVRKSILQAETTGLSGDEIEKLSTLSRGMNKQDLLQAANDYKAFGKMPDPLTHPTNTCNPITGSWTEQLLTIKQWRHIFEDAGYSLKIHTGNYNDLDNGVLKNVAAKLMNSTIDLLGLKQLAGYVIFEAHVAN